MRSIRKSSDRPSAAAYVMRRRYQMIRRIRARLQYSWQVPCKRSHPGDSCVWYADPGPSALARWVASMVTGQLPRESETITSVIEVRGQHCEVWSHRLALGPDAMIRMRGRQMPAAAAGGARDQRQAFDLVEVANDGIPRFGRVAILKSCWKIGTGASNRTCRRTRVAA